MTRPEGGWYPSAMLTRRQWNGGLIATLAALAGGCRTMSPSEEQQLGKESAQEVEETVGLVPDAGVVGYVRQVGGRLAQAAGASDATWQFNVADDAESKRLRAARRLGLCDPRGTGAPQHRGRAGRRSGP
jgi:hypothetical protein